MPCPNCGDQGYYSTYANGTTETGYCQRCSHETLVQTKKKDPRQMTYIEKPKSPKSGKRGR